MRTLLIGAAAVLVVSGSAAAHHAVASGSVIAHHTASSARMEAHHTASRARVEAHHTASSARVEAHHAVSDAALVAGTSAAEENGHELERGPHGGALVPLGDAVAVLEFVFEVETGMFSMHVWDGALENRVPIRQNMVFLKIPVSAERDGAVMLVPKEDDVTGDIKGNAASFIGGLRQLIGREEFEVVLEWVMVKEQSFRLVPFSMPEGNGLGPGHPAEIPEPVTE